MKRWQAALGATTLLLAAACGDRVVPTDITRGVRPGVASHDATSFTGAIYTATNPAFDDSPDLGTDHDLCHNAKDSAPAIDCNIYMSKQFVWLSGGPVGKGLPDGTYVFAVLAPGQQQDPNDCTDKNLSDITPAPPCTTNNSGAGDTWQHRVFSVSSGTITYPAATYQNGHTFANNMIRLMPYDDTPNSGGEYTLAVCQLPATPVGDSGPGVVPSDCKYDNFKVITPENCAHPELPNCGNTVQGATVVTVVHLADHTVISAPVPLGSSVHDKATVTTSDGAAIPDHSKISFYFWKNGTCDGTPLAGPDDHTISGASPLAEDNGQPEGPLGAGSYSYQANFTSGDPTTVSDGEGDCEPLTVSKGTLHISTDVHLDPGHSTFTSAALGSTVHDHATVTGEVTGIPKAHAVTFAFYTNGSCNTGTGSSVSNTGNDNGVGTGVRSASSSALAAGSYSYLATQASDDNYDVTDDTGCEPLTIDKANTTIVTHVHNASHVDITNTIVATGTSIHDNATVGTKIGSFTIGGTVTFSFFTNGSCTGTASSTQTVAIGSESAAQTITTVGAYAYSAKYNGDGNYNASSNSDCEPLSVAQFGKTMGFWGNTNGIAAINVAGGYSSNPVLIGRGSNINSSALSLKVLPNTLNACGKGSPFVFATGAQTASKDCTVATGINTGTLNTNSAQTLALGYNIKLVTQFSGESIASLGCLAYLTAGLTGSNTVTDAFAKAVTLIDGSAAGGTTTQTQLGTMNLLLNCLNRDTP